mgnify:FL=1
MSSTLLGWTLIAASLAIIAPFVFQLRWREAAARLALLSRLRPSATAFGQGTRGRAGTLLVASGTFLLVAGLGAATSYMRDTPTTVGSPGHTTSLSLAHSGLDGETLAQLEDYTRSIGIDNPTPTAATGDLLPDVDTMIERLAARLETAPDDIDGWRMLGWSYDHMERFDAAVAAYARAMELDPSSAELKLAYEETKAKVSDSSNFETASSLPTGAIGKGGDGPSVEEITTSEAMSPHRGMALHERDASIRSMVDGLASRLENAPRDVKGWTRLMRSRVVLGEKEAATTAFHKALEVFKDDSAASTKIEASAIELGLKTE